MILSVLLDQRTHQTREPYDDGWDRGDTENELVDVKVFAGDDRGWNSFELDVQRGDTVHVVINRYSDGDTFGHDAGLCQVLKVFKTPGEALLLRDLIEKMGILRIEDDIYVNDGGYFGSREQVQIWDARVQ
jgi:hypothetical protein